ncbi:MAG: hypothetical protein AAB385_09030 [Planctomycetota bacterium]
MATLSKTIQLGVIILAFQLLGELKISSPRLVLAAAVALGISRKAGYQALERICALLREEKDPSEDLRRELVSLRIRNQVLTYERDHHPVRFADREHHLPRDARELAVRILREFHAELSEEEIATHLSVPLTSLRRWDEEANSTSEIPPKPERRGTHRHASAEDARRVEEEYKSLEKPVTLEEFTGRFNEKYPTGTLDRKTITRILQRAGLRDIETRNEPEPYHGTFKVYFPGAQAALDGTKCDVIFKSEPQETITLTQEVAIDIASGAILGEALGKEENSDGVERVLVRARAEVALILAVLSDNGSGNRSERVERVVAEDGEVGQIFSFPAHPQTNGHMEGFFGQFSRIAGEIELDDSSRESLARSVGAVIWRIFTHFHNYSPRERLDGMSPLEYLRRYHAEPKEVEDARADLKKQKERSENLRKPHPRLSDPLFLGEVKRIVETHRLEVPLERAIRALVKFDSEVIQSASGAFFAYSQRDGFDERKRTFAYFMGIVVNKHKELEVAQIRSHLGSLKTERVRAEGEEARRQIQKEEAEERENLRENPERVILQYAELLLSGRLRFLRERSLERLRRGIKALRRLGRATGATLESLKVTIKSWGKYGEDLKGEMVKLLAAEYELAKSPAGIDSS